MWPYVGEKENTTKRTGWIEAWWMSFSFWLSIYDSWFAWEYGWIRLPCIYIGLKFTDSKSKVPKPNTKTTPKGMCLKRQAVPLRGKKTACSPCRPNMRVADCASVWACNCLQLIYLSVLHLILFDIYLELQTTSFKLMFGETSIVYVNIWNYPIETIIYKSTFRVPGIYMRVASATRQINQFRATCDTRGLYVARNQGRHRHKSAAEPGGFKWVDRVWKIAGYISSPSAKLMSLLVSITRDLGCLKGNPAFHFHSKRRQIHQKQTWFMEFCCSASRCTNPWYMTHCVLPFTPFLKKQAQILELCYLPTFFFETFFGGLRPQ